MAQGCRHDMLALRLRGWQDHRMIARASLALALLAIAAPAQANICNQFANSAWRMAYQRDLGVGPGRAMAEIDDSESAGNSPRIIAVYRAMLREIFANPRLTPEAAAYRSRTAPCGWPGASPMGATGASVPR